MLYFFKIDYKNYQQIETSDLVCPLSGQREPMVLMLYKRSVKTFFYDQIVKKPSGIFFRKSDDKDIPAAKWTPEMERFFEEQKLKNPVPDARFKLTWFGKLFIAFSIFVFMMMAWQILKITVIEPDQKAKAQTELLKLPQKGQQYRVGVPTTQYDSNGKATAKGLDMRWIEIQDVNPKDSTCTIMLIEELAYGAKMDAHIEKAQQSDKTFKTKFKILSENEIEFSVGEGEGFRAFTYGNLENVKR